MMIDQLELNFDAPEHDDQQFNDICSYLFEHYPQAHWWIPTIHDEGGWGEYPRIESCMSKNRAKVWVSTFKGKPELFGNDKCIAVTWEEHTRDFGGGSYPCTTIEKMAKRVEWFLERYGQV